MIVPAACIIRVYTKRTGEHTLRCYTLLLLLYIVIALVYPYVMPTEQIPRPHNTIISTTHEYPHTPYLDIPHWNIHIIRNHIPPHTVHIRPHAMHIPHIATDTASKSWTHHPPIPAHATPTRASPTQHRTSCSP